MQTIGDFNESESVAILSWFETFSFTDEYRDKSSGQLTIECISDGMPLLMFLQDA